MLKTAKRILSLPKYTPGKPIDELERDFGIENAIKLASNENPLGPSPKAKEAIIDAATKSHLYPDGDSYHLKKGIALKEGILPNQIVLGNGSNEVLELIGHCYIEEGDEVLMGEYCFIVYPIVTMLSEGTIVRVDMPNLVHDISSFKSRITELTKVVFLANPNNPTGTIVSTEEIISFLEFLPKNILLVVDEAYSETIKPNIIPKITTASMLFTSLLLPLGITVLFRTPMPRAIITRACTISSINKKMACALPPRNPKISKPGTNPKTMCSKEPTVIIMKPQKIIKCSTPAHV